MKIKSAGQNKNILLFLYHAQLCNCCMVNTLQHIAVNLDDTISSIWANFMLIQTTQGVVRVSRGKMTDAIVQKFHII